MILQSKTNGNAYTKVSDSSALGKRGDLEYTLGILRTRAWDIGAPRP